MCEQKHLFTLEALRCALGAPVPCYYSKHINGAFMHTHTHKHISAFNPKINN